jgi:hypothetical protein
MMRYSEHEHTELTPQHYENLVATGYKFMEFLCYLETEQETGMILTLYKPLRLELSGQNVLPIDDPMIRNLMYANPSIAIFIERDY